MTKARDIKVILAIVSHNPPRGCKLSSKTIQQYKQFILKIINKYDRQFLLEIVLMNGEILQYLSEDATSDKEIVLAAVSNCGSALSYAFKELKGDKEIVLAAINLCGNAFQYASEELKKDNEVLMLLDKTLSNY